MTTDIIPSSHWNPEMLTDINGSFDKPCPFISSHRNSELSRKAVKPRPKCRIHSRYRTYLEHARKFRTLSIYVVLAIFLFLAVALDLDQVIPTPLLPESSKLIEWFVIPHCSKQISRFQLSSEGCNPWDLIKWRWVMFSSDTNYPIAHFRLQPSTC